MLSNGPARTESVGPRPGPGPVRSEKFGPAGPENFKKNLNSKYTHTWYIFDDTNIFKLILVILGIEIICLQSSDLKCSTCQN